ncbi:hypothetical protein ACGFLS_32415 [Streptomyces abikoensis]|uniref:hypothetical protein n=1 Tax=Streptomyces abikoensis TaxID=97398 RepID=UPI003715DA40
MRDETQALAVTLALLLLIGGVLVGDATVGPWWTLAGAAGPVVTGYLAPGIGREIAVRRFRRRVRRWGR